MTSLESTSQLDSILEDSHQKPIAIFKHSTSCGISKMVLKTFTKDIKRLNISANIDLYILDLLKYRPVSNAIANITSVNHESPQLLFIKKGVVVHHSSHGSISADSLL